MAEKKSVFMTSVLTILGSQVMIKLLGLVYRLVITNIGGFGDYGNGYYNAGFQVYTILLAISSVGIPNAISKLVSAEVAVGNRNGAHEIFRTALKLFFIIGAVCSALLYFGADFIALYLLRMDGVQYTLQALAPSVIFVCLSSVVRGYFVGLGNVKATSNSQVLEQVFKSTLTILFVLALSSTSAEIMSAGANFATTVATMLSFVYVTVFYFKRRGTIREALSVSSDTKKSSFGLLAKTILAVSIPISFSSIITAVGRVVDVATITRGIEAAFQNGIPGVAGIPTKEMLGDEAVRLSGMLSKGDSLTNLPLALNIAFSTVLVPTISAALASGNKKEASDKISFSVLISILLILPCCVGMIILAKPIYQLIYPNASLGSDLFQIATAAVFFTCMDQTLCGSLQGIGKVAVPAKALLCGVAAKIGLNLILIRIPSINIYGAAISSVVCHVTACSICFISLYRATHFPISFRRYVVKPVLCSAGMACTALSVYWLVNTVLHSNTIAVFAAVFAAVIVYAALLLVLRVLKTEEIELLPFGRRITSLLKKYAG